MSIVMGILVPRAIGPSAYGDFSYIISTYGFLFQLFMFTSSTAYIYFLSHNKYHINEVNTFYFIFLFMITMMVVIVGLITISTEFGLEYLWNGLNDKYLLYLGLILGIFSQLQARLTEFSDSTAQTIQSEKIKLLSKFLMVLSVVTFILFDSLDIYSYFILSILNFVLFIMLFIKYINFQFAKVNKEKIVNIFEDFYVYLKPLIVFTLIAAIYSYLGKYVLQSSSGSLEQGYYNFAFQLALIPVTFISSIMAIYMSEMTKKFQVNDLAGVKEIFVNNIFKIYAIHAFIAFFMLVNAKEIILLTVGEQFLGATGALQTLSIFSLLHTFGMLSGNLFFSSGRNKQYSIINSTTMILGIVYLLYILFNSNLNASHLAVVMASFYGARVMIQLYINMNHLSIGKVKFMGELVLVTLIVFGTFKFIHFFGLNLFINLLLATLILLVINYIFKDYIKLNAIKVLKR
jgi:O-antigen/teichoic acid export membrane protein